MPVTPLLGITFGGPPSGYGYGQRKFTLPVVANYRTVAEVLSGIFRQPDDDIPIPPIDFGIPELPVEIPQWELPESTSPVLRSVLPEPVGVWSSPVRRTTVVVGDVSTEVEQHEEGDFPVGSIFAPGEVWGSQQEPHELDVYDEEEEPVAHDWGHLIRQGIGGVLGVEDPWGGTQQIFNPQNPGLPSGRVASAPSAAPVMSTEYANGEACGNRRYVTLDRQTGKISCKRRRRRRLLTNRDLADLASLKTITGGGAALNAAVIRAVR